MKKLRLAILAGIVMSTACSSGVNRKVLIIGRGRIVARENKVTMKDGSGYTEETVDGDKQRVR